MALSANREVDHYIDQELRTFQVKGSTHIYKGGFIGLDTNGYARPLAAGDQAVGIAYEEMDNSGGNDGALAVRVYTKGDFAVALASSALSNIGDAVYASDDGTATLTSAGNSFLGHCVDVPAANQVLLRLNPFQVVA